MLIVSILLMSYISLISNSDLNPCEAIDLTKKNLSNVAVIFVNLRLPEDWKPFKNNTSRTTEEQRQYFIHFSRNNSVLEIMKTFFKCQQENSGLQIEKLTFEKDWNKNKSCVLSENQTVLDYSIFSGKIVRIFVFPDYIHECQSTGDELDLVISELMQEAEKYYQYKLEICYTAEECKKQRKDIIPISVDSLFYENWRSAVDKLNSSSQSIFPKYNNIESKYLYFSIETEVQRYWASVLAVVTVIALFLSGLCICCCGLVVFALVEEDFKKRNEEREWMALHLRREEHVHQPMSPTTSTEESSNATALSKPPTKSESGIDTARSRNNSVSSSSSSDVVTDRTQLSETISGTINANSSDETELETAKTSN